MSGTEGSETEGSGTEGGPPRATRDIVRGEALAWLEATSPPANASVITSLPDVSELQVDGGPMGLEAWRAWFVDAARRIIRWVPDRVAGAVIDKGYLVMRAAEEESARMLFHKIVCRHPPGSIAHGRPGYSHLIGITRGAVSAPRKPGPEVLPDAGFMPWSRAMGVEACKVACRFLVENTATRVVVDPFCGKGTVLAVANAMGLDAIGVELSAKRCRAARTLSIDLDAEAPSVRPSADR